MLRQRIEEIKKSRNQDLAAVSFFFPAVKNFLSEKIYLTLWMVAVHLQNYFNTNQSILDYGGKYTNEYKTLMFCSDPAILWWCCKLSKSSLTQILKLNVHNHIQND